MNNFKINDKSKEQHFTVFMTALSSSNANVCDEVENTCDGNMNITKWRYFFIVLGEKFHTNRVGLSVEFRF